MAAKIFISHASQDEPLASALVDCILACMVLADEDVRCTSVPGHKLPVGSDFAQTLREELGESSVVVGLITANAIRSSWVLFELGATWGAGRELMPLVASDVDIASLPGPLSGRHVAQMWDRDDVTQFIGELTKCVAAPARSSPKISHAIGLLLAAHEAYAQGAAGKARTQHAAPASTPLGITREALRWGITVGWQLARYEFFYESPFPEARAQAPTTASEIRRLLRQDGFPDDVGELPPFHEMMHAVLTHYSTTSAGKYAAIMIGVAAMRASLVGASGSEESNREMETLAFSALSEIDPAILPNKTQLFARILESRPRAVVEVIQLVDEQSV